MKLHLKNGIISINQKEAALKLNVASMLERIRRHLAWCRELAIRGKKLLLDTRKMNKK
jgi:hypothetical protein